MCEGGKGQSAESLVKCKVWLGSQGGEKQGGQAAGGGGCLMPPFGRAVPALGPGVMRPWLHLCCLRVQPPRQAVWAAGSFCTFLLLLPLFGHWALEVKRGCLPSGSQRQLGEAEAVSAPSLPTPPCCAPPSTGQEHGVLAAGMSQDKSAESHRQVQPPSLITPFLESSGARANHSTGSYWTAKMPSLAHGHPGTAVSGAAQVAGFLICPTCPHMF